MKYAFVGDVHEKLPEYVRRAKQFDGSVCVGDLGFSPTHELLDGVLNGHHRVLPGNHDDYPLFTGGAMSRFLPNNFGFHQTIGPLGYFYVRGALSIDQHSRTEGVDWFREEQLTTAEQWEAHDAYCTLRPEIVVTHECPSALVGPMFNLNTEHDKVKSSMGVLFDHMLDSYCPNLWVFGHYHRNAVAIVDDKNYFICLSELGTFEFDTADTLYRNVVRHIEKIVDKGGNVVRLWRDDLYKG